jgi:hypothetical protein
LALVLIFQPLTSMTIASATFVLPILLIAFVGVLGLVYRVLGRDEGIAATCFALSQLLLFSNCIALLNYLGLALHRPLNDAFLAQTDSALGLDWWAYVVWLKSNPFVAQATTMAYNSSLIQFVVAILLLGFTRRFERLDQLSLAFMIGAIITVGAWCLFPSFGALPLHYAQGMAQPSFFLAMSKQEALGLLALHSGPVPPLRFDQLTGLIGCPSFHTVIAILTVHGLRRVAWAGPVAAAVSIPVFLSIPADGGHHFIDIAAGVVVAAASIALANLALRQRLERPVIAQEAFA